MVIIVRAVGENPTPQQIHCGMIRAHHAKTGYDYPTIRLPFTFSGLIGRSTRIVQTVYDGALAFLVVVSSESSPKSEATPCQERKPSPLHGEGRRFKFGRAHRLFFQSGATINPEAQDSEGEELHNFNEKLHNFGATDNDVSLARSMTDRYIDEEGNEQIEMLWDELIPEDGDEYDKNDPYHLKAQTKKALSSSTQILLKSHYVSLDNIGLNATIVFKPL